MGVLAGICLAAVGTAAAAEAAPAPVIAFRGLGTWVDLYDAAVRADPEAAVAQMRADGVRTLYLETSNFTAASEIVAPDIVSRFIVAAHADGMRVVAWYLPSFARPGLDRDRALAPVRFRRRTRRLLDLAAALRSGAGAAYPLGAIVPAPAGMQLNPAYLPSFPFRPLQRLFTAFLPMDYFNLIGGRRGGQGGAAGHARERVRGRPQVPLAIAGTLAAPKQ
ncbi:MAG TPA: hypothetical protein VGI72_07055 [Gaiellales bacterium]